MLAQPKIRAGLFIDLVLKRHPILLITLALLGCTTLSLGEKEKGQGAKDTLATAIKKSKAQKTCLFKKKIYWVPGLRAVAINGYSEAGIYRTPHLRYKRVDQIKFVLEEYWIDGFRYTKENLMSREGAWEKSPVGKMIATFISYPFQLDDPKSFTVKKIAKEGTFNCYVLVPSKVHQLAIVHEIIGKKVATFGNTETDLKDSTVEWTIVIDPKTHLIRRIDQKIMTKVPGSVTADTSIEELLPNDVYQLKHSRCKISHTVSGVSHITTTQFSYPEDTKIEIPGKLQKMLEQKQGTDQN